MSKRINVVALDEFGGLQALYCSLLSALRARGVDVVTFNRARRHPAPPVLDRAGPRDDIISPAALLPFDGVRGTFRARRLLGQANLLWHVRREVGRSKARRVILWNAFPYPAYTPPGSSMILYDHGLSSIRHPDGKDRDRLKDVERIICVSHANKRLLRERWRYERRVDVLPNPLRPDIPVHIAATPKQLRDRAPVIGCAARLVAVKGIVSIVHAVGRLRDRGIATRLKIAGTGPELDRLRNVVRALDLDGRVEFVGQIKDMAAFYNEIDIYAAPSLREPFGLSVLEAMANGLPVILSNVDGHPEAIPYRDAAIFVEPTLPLRAYYDLGASVQTVPSEVYSPASDAVVVTKGICPVLLADAVECCIRNHAAYANAAFAAAKKIPMDFSFDTYVDSYLGLVL